MSDHPGTPSSAPELVLLVRSGDGSSERRILDVRRITTEASIIAAASAAAAAGELLLVDDQELPVFDLRAPHAGDSEDPRPGADAPAADPSVGCLLIGNRGGVHVALLVD